MHIQIGCGFTDADALHSTEVASDRSENERVVTILKLCNLISNWMRSTQSFERTNFFWLCFTVKLSL